MAFIKNSGRQEPVVSYSSITFGVGKGVDAAGTYSLIEIPHKSVITKVYINTVTPTSAGVAVSLGDSLVPTRYASGVSVDVVGMTELSTSGYKTPTTHNINLVVTGTPIVSGLIEFYVEYITEGHADFSQGV
jgi:hypothetical protein